VLEGAKEGFYDTAASRKHVDGRLHTFQSKQERNAELQKAEAAGNAQLAESLKHLASLEEDDGVPPARMRKELSDSENRKPAAAAQVLAVEKAKVEDILPALGPCSLLKKAPPACVASEEKTDMPPPEQAIKFMMGALTDTLQGLRNDMQDL
jgi:hypothetical protein